MIRESILYIATAACLATGLAGCDDEMTTSSSTQIADSQALGSATGLNMLLEGNYNCFYFQTNSSDFRNVFKGITGNYMLDMMRGTDVICNDNLGGEQYDGYMFSSSYTQANGTSIVMWKNLYSIINQCNIIIDNIDAAVGEETVKTHIKGQTLAMRGYCYFQLVQFYQQTYAIAKEKPGVLLRLSSTGSNDVPRSTVAQCYEQIVSDLTSARTLLADFSRAEKYYLDKDVVTGMLARVYQVMGDWEKARTEAQAAFQAYGTLMTRDEWRSGFCHADYAEIIWGFKQTTDTNMGDNGMFCYWYNFPQETGSEPFYNFKNYFANDLYVQLFEETDDRYLFWHRTDTYTDKWAYSKFYDAGDGQGHSRGDYILMRGSEMLLILAESEANLGNTAEALAHLNQLQAARNVIAKTTTTAQAELLEAIYTERRKELLGEGGGGMLDLLRLQKPLVRAGDHFDPGKNPEVFPLPSNDYRFIFQIPQREIQLNEALNESDQNPFSGQ